MDNIYYLLEKMEKTKTKHLKHWVVLKKTPYLWLCLEGQIHKKKWGENSLFVRKNRKLKIYI